jgi:hypothetical protein
MVQRGLGVTLAAALSDWPRTNLRSLIRAVVRASWRLAAAPLMAERADWHGLNLALVTIRWVGKRLRVHAGTDSELGAPGVSDRTA